MPINLNTANEVAVAVKKVINQRKEHHLVKIEEKKRFYEELLEKVRMFEEFRQDTLLAQEQSKSGQYYSYFRSDPTLVTRVTNATAVDTIKKIEECIALCNHLYNRFNRSTLNISVIGRARQGKSSLLQSISGLSNAVIPAADGGDCTGTTSMIQNNPSVIETYAEIKFYSPEEMVKIVKAYLEELGLNISVHDFNSIPSLNYLIDRYNQTLKKQFNADQQSLFKHLSKYITHYHDIVEFGEKIEGYEKYVSRGSLTIREDEIREYVAQYNVNNIPVYKYLAVKEVLIHTKFAVPQVGDIVLVDTIGLGDTSLGIEDKMLDTLRENSDAAFLVRFPVATGDNWKKEDNKLHMLIENAMGREMLDKWLYLVINTMEDGQNENSANALINSVKDLDLHFADIIRVNCMNQEEVYNKLLLPALRHLSENLIQVDNNLMEEANKTFNECYTSYLWLYDAANSILTNSPQSQGQLALFGINKWEVIREEIKTALGQLSSEYENNEDYQNVDSADALDRAREEIFNKIPSMDWYKEKLAAMGPQDGPMSVYEIGCNYTRADIMTEFSKVNCDVLQSLEYDFKYEFISLLFNVGRWGEIPLETYDNSTCSIEWLEAFRDEKLKDRPNLRKLVDTILTYKITMSDSLAKGVVKTLRYINPRSHSFVAPDMDDVERFGVNSNEALAEFLYDSMDVPLTEIKEELEDVVNEASTIPNFSFSTHAELIRNMLVMKNEAMKELRDFYILNSATIWGEDFKATVAADQTVGALSAWINGLMTARKPNFIILLS